MTFLRIVLTGVLMTTPFAPVSAAAPHFSDWSPAVNLGANVNSNVFDAAPHLSKDRRSLYFTSNRPGGIGVNDIWVSQRSSVEAPWGPPMNLGTAINTAAGEAGPSLSRDGHLLFFASNRAGGQGNVDIWVSYREHIHDDFGWQPAVNVGPGVNTPGIDQDPSFFQNDDGGVQQLFFARAPVGSFSGDIFVSDLQPDGTFGPAMLVPELSSPDTESGPSVRFDGLEILFSSNRPGGSGQADLWSSTRSTVFDLWSAPANLGPLVNSDAQDAAPDIASDRQTLYFASSRPGVGGNDVFVTTRTKKNEPPAAP
jgi:Tol biopolymer transport system component